MQRLIFIEGINQIAERLYSEQIIEVFNKGFLEPNKDYPFSDLQPFLFASKSQFDQLLLDDDFSTIISELDYADVYNENNLSILANYIGNAKASFILTKPEIVQFYVFHNSLIQTLSVTNTFLKNDILKNNSEEDLENGVIIFQVKIKDQGLPPNQYAKILTLLDELVLTINKIYKTEEELSSEIIFLDSGSDSNIGLKTNIDTAKSLFLIFKEIWDLITNYKFYKQNKKNQAIIDSLTIRAEIKKLVENGVLGVEEGKEYTHIIKTRTDDLIGLKVFPRQLTLSKKNIDLSHMLSEYESMRMLESKNE